MRSAAKRMPGVNTPPCYASGHSADDGSCNMAMPNPDAIAPRLARLRSQLVRDVTELEAIRDTLSATPSKDCADAQGEPDSDIETLVLELESLENTVAGLIADVRRKLGGLGT